LRPAVVQEKQSANNIGLVSELVIFFPCRSSTRICTTATEEGRAAAAVTREKCTSWTSREEERAVSREREERESESE